MSRIGKKPIEIPSGVQVTVVGPVVTVKSPKGTLTHTMHRDVFAKVEGQTLTVGVADENNREFRMQWGTNASIIKSMIEGVTAGFKKQLEINGVGYKVAQNGQKLSFQLGYTHPMVYEVPQGVKVEIEKNILTISGIDKHLVGQVAAHIRTFRKPEPYKGKGIKYVEETIRRKAGKAATAAAA